MQQRRLEHGGDIDRSQPIYFSFNHRLLQGYAGDSLASALLANNVRLIARSIKYHRPRGIISAGLEEASALVCCHGKNGSATPNLKATEVRLENNLIASSQNCWPRVDLDIGALLQSASALLVAGFYYKTFMWPKTWWHRVYEKIIRRAAGQGRASTKPGNNLYDRRQAYCELLVIGSGPAGLSATLAAAEQGARVILLEQDSLLGGSATWEQTHIDSIPARQWRQQTLEKIAQLDNISVFTNCLAFGHYDHGCITAIERRNNTVDSISWRFRADRVLFACGATEKPLVFPDNDRPGVMLAASVRQYIYRYAVKPGNRAVLAIADPSERELTRQALHHAGIEISDELLLDEERICATRGHLRLRRVDTIDSHGIRREIHCDLLCTSGGWSPNIHLMAQLGDRMHYDSNQRCLLPPAQIGIALCCGASRGLQNINDCVNDGRQQALNAISQIRQIEEKFPLSEIGNNTFSPMLHEGRGAVFVDLQNDVTRTDIELAAREGYDNVELLKRYTTLGMGTDQGKTSWTNAIGELERIGGRDARDIGHTSFRPPYSPVSIGALIGAEVDQHMTPIRHTPFHSAFSEQGCVFQNSGEWLYSRYFPLPGESMEQAIHREVLAVRNAVGCVDMSTLGKVDVKGNDALEFLSRLYCNNLDTIKPGRLRYALMLREDGILWDDGTVAQLGENHFLVTMTTANASAVWRWMNKLLQLHWPDLDVQITSVSDCWASLAIAGPKARELLQRLNPDFDTARETLPFASVREGKLDNEVPCRVFSVSFSGELSYEINVPSGYAGWLFDTVIQRGIDLGITPYGLEALDVLRIEKGHLSIGTEIDGRTTPDDLGLGRMVSNSKSFIGSKLLQRPALQQASRLQLVGLKPVDEHSPIPLAAHLCNSPWQNGETQISRGRLTASITSPTLNQPIALALLENGHQSLNNKMWAVSPIQQQSVEISIVPACFYDPKGERLSA